MAHRMRRRVHDDTWKSTAVAHLAAENGDPALQRELEHVEAAEHASSRGFRQAWDRFFLAVFAGR